MKLALFFILGCIAGVAGYHFFSPRNLYQTQSELIQVSTVDTEPSETNNIISQELAAQVSELEQSLVQKDIEIEQLNNQLQQSPSEMEWEDQQGTNSYIAARKRWDCERFDRQFAAGIVFEFMDVAHNFYYELTEGERLSQDQYTFACRETICELRVMEKDIEIWEKILVELDRQSWWQWQSMSDNNYVASDPNQETEGVKMIHYLFEFEG